MSGEVEGVCDRCHVVSIHFLLGYIVSMPMVLHLHNVVTESRQRNNSVHLKSDMYMLLLCVFDSCFDSVYGRSAIDRDM